MYQQQRKRQFQDIPQPPKKCRSLLEEIVEMIKNPQESLLSDMDQYANLKKRRNFEQAFVKKSKTVAEKWAVVQKECKEIMESNTKLNKIFENGHSLLEVRKAVKQTAQNFIRRHELQKIINESSKSFEKRDAMMLLGQSDMCDWDLQIKRVMEAMEIEERNAERLEWFVKNSNEKRNKSAELDLRAREQVVDALTRAHYLCYVEMIYQSEKDRVNVERFFVFLLGREAVEFSGTRIF